MDVGAYLDRLGIAKTERPSLAFLEKFQQQHFLKIPFENLDIHHPNRRIVLALDHLFEKIVVEKRGGFCYELTGLFCWLISELGFVAEQIPAKVFNTQLENFGPEFAHMALLVHLEKSYLVDVGFGESSRSPIEMPDGQTHDVGGAYRVVHAQDQTFDLERKTQTTWDVQYRFVSDPQPLSAFNEMCVYHQTSDKSHFTQNMVITKATPVESQADFDRLLHQHFGLSLTLAPKSPSAMPGAPTHKAG